MKQLTKKEIKKAFKKEKRDQEIVLVLENIQYARNVASLFRTADAAGVRKIYLTGISQHPPFGKELSQASRAKEKSMPWEYVEMADSGKLFTKLKSEGFYIVAVELTDESKPLTELKKLVKGKGKVALVAGNEVYGIVKATLPKCDAAVFIPMFGRGASLNVSTSMAIALYGI